MYGAGLSHLLVSLCSSLIPVMERIAAAVPDVKVGIIDVSNTMGESASLNEATQAAAKDLSATAGLIQRFPLKGFPGIFLLHDGETRHYLERKEFDQLVAYARGSWRLQAPVPRWRGPTSWPSRLYGKIIMLPVMGHEVYRFLKDNYKLHDLTIVFIFFAVLFGLSIAGLAVVDWYFYRWEPSATCCWEVNTTSITHFAGACMQAVRAAASLPSP